MKCREHCGACCIAASIAHPIPGMPLGKPAGVACVNLDPEDLSCRIWGTALYPDTCDRFTPELPVCGESREQALQLITALEIDTSTPGSTAR